MKAFIAFSCLLAVASASYWGVPAAYHAQHVPIIGPGGVPLEPPANVAARAAHAAAVVAAGGHAGPLLGHGLAPAHGGVPADTPEVAAAKAQHAAAHAAARGHGAVVAAPWAAAPWAYAHHGIASHGVLPAETPEVAAARAAHLAAHAAAAHGGHAAVHVPVHDDGSYHGEHNHLYGEDDGQYHGEW